MPPLVPALFLAPFLSGSPAPGGELPWTLQRSYKYLWTVEGQKVGESRLLFREEKGGKGTLYTLTSHRGYKYKGSELSVRATFTFKADGIPVRYEEECAFKPILPQYRALQELRVSFSKNKVTTVYVNNQREQNAVRTEAEVPPQTYLFPTQAVEQWAVLTMPLKGSSQKTLNIFYPEHKKVLRVAFQRESEGEPLLVGNKKVKASLYHFECRETKYKGKVWLDGKGRLLRFESGPLRLVLAAIDG